MGKIKGWEKLGENSWISNTGTSITIGNPIIPNSNPIEFWEGVYLVAINKNGKPIILRRFDDRNKALKFKTEYMRGHSHG